VFSLLMSLFDFIMEDKEQITQTVYSWTAKDHQAVGVLKLD